MRARLAADIGGTFTDVVLESPAGRDTAKVLTTAAPEVGVLDGVRRVLAAAGLPPSEVSVFVHGTTLATNALIERKGARTAFVTTEGMRDIVEMGYEKRSYSRISGQTSLDRQMVTWAGSSPRRISAARCSCSGQA